MSLEDLKAGITLQIDRYGYTEIDADQLDALSSFWVEEQGWSLAHKAGTSIYVVYRPRQDALRTLGEEAIRWAMLNQAPFNPYRWGDAAEPSTRTHDSRPLPDYNSYNRTPRGYRMPRWTDGETQFVEDPTLDPGSVLFGYDGEAVVRVDNLAVPTEPTNQTATGTLMEAARERELARLQEWADGPDLPAQRPDHYRARLGLCVCGFTSYFQRDMDLHISDAVVDGPNGVPGRLRRCESCGASRWCREVALMGTIRLSFNAEFDPTRGPEISTERVYRCDNCTRGL